MYLSIGVLTGTFLTRKLYMRYIFVVLNFNYFCSICLSELAMEVGHLMGSRWLVAQLKME